MTPKPTHESEENTSSFLDERLASLFARRLARFMNEEDEDKETMMMKIDFKRDVADRCVRAVQKSNSEEEQRMFGLAVIESFASSAVISSGAAAALQEATEEFATRLFQDVFFVAHQRLSLCVHAGDVDAAIDLTGAYQLVGRRRVSGDLCASCIKPDGPATRSGCAATPAARRPRASARRGCAAGR